MPPYRGIVGIPTLTHIQHVPIRLSHPYPPPSHTPSPVTTNTIIYLCDETFMFLLFLRGRTKLEFFTVLFRQHVHTQIEFSRLTY